MQSLFRLRVFGVMASITIRNLSAESKARLRRRADQRGCSLEALARSILEEAAGETVESNRFPHDLMEVIEPGEEIEPLLRVHDETQGRVDLT